MNREQLIALQPTDRLVWKSLANREDREGFVVSNHPEVDRLKVVATLFGSTPLTIEYRQVTAMLTPVLVKASPGD